MFTRCRYLTLLIATLLAGTARSGAAQTPAPAYNPANGHWYQLVHASRPLTWAEARAAAEALSYAGYRGHLAAVTSPEENQFVAGYLTAIGSPNPAWIGGYQDTTAPDYHEPDGGWRWITGEPWQYTSWHDGEPSNSGGAENHLETYNDGTWNDTDLAATSNYLVEFEPPIQPALTLSVSPLPVPPVPAGGRQTLTGQVVLAQPAGPNGVTVLLSSDHPNSAAVPSTVSIPAGQSAAVFPVTIYPVALNTSVILSAYAPAGGATIAIPLTGLGLPLPLVGGALTAPAYNPANGHWYQVIRASLPLTWTDARTAAAALSYAGYPGHLATVTTPEEDQFVAGYLTASGPQNPAWIGGYQDTTAPDYREPDGGWRWITGEPWQYTSWRDGEPSNSGGAENHLETYNDGTWNDTDLAATNTYLVEFEPQGASVPPQSAQLVLFPNPALGGQPALGQVALSPPAGPGGVVVTLASSNPAAAVVPAAVTVPAGAPSVTFDITTLPVTAPTLVSIVAASSFGTTTAILTVLPLSPPLVAAAALPAPTNLTARFLPGAGVQLAWQDNSPDETAFALWRKGGGSGYPPKVGEARSAPLAPHTTAYRDRTVAPGVTYTYRVRAIRGSTASDWSNEVMLTPVRRRGK